MEALRTEFQASKKLIIAILLAFLVSGITPPADVHAASKNLDVSAIDQEQSQWCWVTAPQIIIKYYFGSAPSQCTLVKRGKDINTCPNEPGTLDETKRAMTESGISNGGTTISGAASFNTIKSEINNGRPLILRKEWKDGKGKKTGIGHLSVIHGYSESEQTGINYVNTVRIRESNSYKASTSYSSMTDNSEFAWTHTIYNIRK